MGAESRLHMPDWNLGIECGERSRRRCRCVSMDKNHIRAALLEHIAKAGEHACGDIGEILPLSHDVQVEIRPHVKDAQHLIKHLAMLPRHAHDCFEFFRTPLELLHQRTHLYCLRTGAED